MKKKKFLLIMITTIFIMIFLTITCYASSFNFNVNPEEKTITAGDSVEIELSIDEIDAGEEGINVIEMKFEYDKDIFENFSFTENNEWKLVKNEEDGRMLWYKMTAGVKTSEKIGSVTLKSKNDLETIDTEVKFLNITSNDGYELIPFGDKIVRIHAVKKEQPQVSPSPVPSIIPEPSEKVPETTNTPKQTTVVTTPKTEQIVVTTPKTEPTVAPTPTTVVKQVVENIKTGDIKPIIALVIIVTVLIVNVVLIIIKKRKKEDK